MGNTVHLLFDYNPTRVRGGAWLHVFSYGGRLYWCDDEGTRLLDADGEAARSAAIDQAWQAVQEWESVRLVNADVNHPQNLPEMTLEECLRDTDIERDEDFLRSLPTA